MEYPIFYIHVEQYIVGKLGYIPQLFTRYFCNLGPFCYKNKLQEGGMILRYDFMAGAQIVPKNCPLDREEKREECVLCARAQNQSLEVCVHTEKGLCTRRKMETRVCLYLLYISLPGCPP
jgi:hypothetical protein